ncbi:MAG: polyamine aminopropyltransferase [Gemmatimonadota bacterium]|nr:MAG: polyamine aminopropyltransferase [Gemmatimonadota bacterium]
MDFSRDEYYVENVTPTHHRCLKLRDRIFCESSEFQRIEVVDTHDYGRMLVLDGTIQATERDTFIYHEVLVHPPLLMQQSPASVLVVGGGDGGVLVELLKHRSVEKVIIVEIDEMVIDASRRHLQNVCGTAFDDPRIELRIADGRKFIETSPETFDLIVLDLTDPIGPSKSFYTREAYEYLLRRLGPTGVVATHAGGWFDYPKVTSTIVTTLGSVFNHVAVFPIHVSSYAMEIAFTYASQSVNVGSFPAGTFADRYAALCNDAELSYVTADFVERMAFQPVLMRKCLRSSDRVSTDEDPLEFTDYYPWGLSE